MVQATDQLNAEYLSDALDRTGFGSVLPNTKLSGATALAEALRKSVADKRLYRAKKYGRDRVVAEAGDVLDAAVRD